MKETSTLPDACLAAEKLLAKAGIASPPTDLPKILSLWPNLFLIEEELEGSGYLLSVGEFGAEILVNRGDREERKRFTIAHELGHWVLGISVKKKTGHFSQPHDVRPAEIEKWCDSFAANLLMPTSIMRASVNPNDPMLTIDLVTHAASRFKVSEEAFFIRAWEVLKLQVAYLRVSRNSGSKKLFVEKSFADKDAETFLKDFLETSNIASQPDSQPFFYFSLATPGGKVRCVGRNIAPERLFFVLKWPDPSENFAGCAGIRK